MASVTDAQRAAVKALDVRAVAAAAGVVLRGAAEQYGPCPKCGGDDRFHVKQNGWFCRRCHAAFGDAPGFLMWLRGLSYPDAVAALLGGAVAPLPSPAKPQEGRSKPFDPAATERKLQEAAERLQGPQGGAGRDYLERRGLGDPALWTDYGLGLASVRAPHGGGVKALAIALPWRDVDGQLWGVRYRFLEATAGQRLTAAYGSTLTGGFGWQGLPQMGRARRFRALWLCEGEFNALSIAAEGTGYEGDLRADALSLGSQSAHLPAAALALAREYGSVLVWADEAERAERWLREAAKAGVRAAGVRSPGGLDANDLRLRGELTAFLSLQRWDNAQTPEARDGAMWDLWDTKQRRGLNEDEAKVLAEMEGAE